MIILRQSGKSWKIHGKTLKGNAGSPISNILWGLRLSPERTSWQLWMTLKFHTLGSTKTKTAKKIIKVIRFMSQCEPATELTTWHSQLKMFACKSRLDRNPFFRSARETIYTQHTAGTSCRFEALSPCNRQADSLRKTRDAQPFSQQKQQICHWDVLSPTSKCFCWIQMARFFDVFCWSILNPPPSCIRFFFPSGTLKASPKIISKGIENRLTKKTSWSLAHPAMTPCFSCAWSNHPLISLAEKKDFHGFPSLDTGWIWIKGSTHSCRWKF